MSLRRSIFAVVSAALIASAAAASGCGGASVESLCQRACDCESCGPNDLAECKSELDASQQAAAAAHCEALYETQLDCYDARFVCLNDNVEVEGCEVEEKAVLDCMQANTAPNACDQAADHVHTCAGEPTTGTGSAQCKGADLCTANCFNAASCEEIADISSSDPDPDSPLLQCVGNCGS